MTGPCLGWLCAMSGTCSAMSGAGGCDGTGRYCASLFLCPAPLAVLTQDMWYWTHTLSLDWPILCGVYAPQYLTQLSRISIVGVVGIGVSSCSKAN
eukprot:3278957-Rhodomonas_salina.1